MFSIRDLLLRHGYIFLFSYVFAVGVGMPLPADPLLLVMGAFAGDELYHFWPSVVLATIAAVSSDYLWYELGRFRGRAVLGFVCKWSLEPDTCVRKAETAFAKRGTGTLLIAKFVPGMSLITMPLSGLIGMPRWRFLAADAAGSLLWSSAYLFAGYVFHRQVNALIGWVGLLGQRAGLVVAGLITAYLGFKYIQRRRFLHQLRVDRITPEALRDMLDSGSAVTVVDLRHPAEVEREGFKLPGALILRPDDVRSRSGEIPKGHEIILYCTCPNEATSAKVALQLKHAGVRRVRPLAGGLEAWRGLGFPLESVAFPSPDSTVEAYRADQ